MSGDPRRHWLEVYRSVESARETLFSRCNVPPGFIATKFSYEVNVGPVTCLSCLVRGR